MLRYNLQRRTTDTTEAVQGVDSGRHECQRSRAALLVLRGGGPPPIMRAGAYSRNTEI